MIHVFVSVLLVCNRHKWSELLMELQSWDWLQMIATKCSFVSYIINISYIYHYSQQCTYDSMFLTYPKNHPNEIIPKPVHCFTLVWMNHQHDDEYHRHLMKKSSRRDLTVSGLSEGPQLNVSRIISTCLLCLLVTMHLLITDIEDTFENAQWGKSHKKFNEKSLK